MQDTLNLNEFYKGLDIMFAKKDAVETERYLRSSLAAARNLNDLSGITAVSNELGGFCRVTGKLAEAKEAYGIVLENLEALGMRATENYATALINSGNVRVAGKEIGKALSDFNEARDILIACGLSGDYRMAALCNNISAAYREVPDLKEAERMARTALDIIAALPEYKTEYATTCINLAEVQIKQGKLELAKENLLLAIGIYERETGGGDIHYSMAHAALGEVNFYQGSYQEAEVCYGRALSLIERDFGRTPVYEAVAGNLEQVRKAREQARFAQK